MISIEKYGVTLRSIQISDLEMIRKWRNADNVREFFEHRDLISRKEQSEWFAALDPATNLYFLVHMDGVDYGVVSLKEIDWSTGQAEAGIFMGSAEYVKSHIPVVAVILLMQLGFEILHLVQLRAKIHLANNNAIRFNEALGYRRLSVKPHSQFAYFEARLPDFQTCTRRFISVLQKSYGRESRLMFEDQGIDFLPLKIRQYLKIARGVAN